MLEPPGLPILKDATGRTIEEIERIANAEIVNQKAVADATTMWTKISTGSVDGPHALLPNAHSQLNEHMHNVQSEWPDDDTSRPTAFDQPVNKALADIEAAVDDTAMVPFTLKSVSDVLGLVAEKVPPLVHEYRTLEKQAQQLNAQLASPGAGANYEAIQFALNNVLDQMQTNVNEAGQPIVKLGGAYLTAKEELAQATSKLTWSGGQSATPAHPTEPQAPRGPGSASPPGGGPTGGEQPGGEQPGGQQPGGEQPGSEQPGSEQPGSEQPGSEQPGGQQQPPGGGLPPGGNGPGGADQGGGPGGPDIPPNPDIPGYQGGGGNDLPPDTGLSGNQSPGPPTLPKPPDSPGGGLPPGGGIGGGGGIGPVGGGGVGGGGAGGGGTPRIDQAGRNLTAPSGPGAGQAPGLAGRAVGAAGGSAAGGMPPMMPPMMPPGAGAGGNANGQPKPGTAPAAGNGRSRPAGPTPGVPSGLRGRSGNDEVAPRAAAGSRRQRRDGPQTVEMLDSELWEVEPSKSATDQAPTRKTGTPRPAN